MLTQVGNYLVEIENNSILVTPMPRAREQKIQKATFAEIFNIRPKYVRDYCYTKAQYSGWIYLIHFNKPYEHAEHYMGFTKNVDRRMLRHVAGRGARLMQVIEDAGITWKISRVWYGDRYLERRLKKQGGHARKCPICQRRKSVLHSQA